MTEERAYFTVYVGNVGFDVSSEEFRELANKFGSVKGTRLVRGRSGESRGFGFIEYATEESRKACIEALNNKEFKGHKLKVEVAVSKGRSSRTVKFFDRDGDVQEEMTLPAFTCE